MTDIFASVALGVAGFFLPGIFKSIVTRKRTMTIGSTEARDAFVYESVFDPLSMARWFSQPKEMHDNGEGSDDDDEGGAQNQKGANRFAASFRVLCFPVFLALLTQVSLVLLQLASTQEIVSKTGTQGPGITLSVSSTSPSLEEKANRRVSRCLPTPTGKDSLSSITTCYDTFFLLSGYPSLSNDRYRMRISRTFASPAEEDLVAFGLELGSEVFIRLVSVSPRILSRSGREAFVTVNEENITANNEALLDLAENVLFPNQGCQRSPTTSYRNTEYETQWEVLFNCFGPPFALGNNGETSSKFNTFSSLLADSFQTLEGTSTYYEDSSDAAFAVGALNATAIEYSTSVERVLSDEAIVAILVAVLVLKLLTDLIFGEDVLYKTAVLVQQISADQIDEIPPFTSLLRATGKLKYKNRRFIVPESVSTCSSVDAASSDSNGASGDEEDDSMRTQEGSADEPPSTLAQTVDGSATISDTSAGWLVKERRATSNRSEQEPVVKIGLHKHVNKDMASSSGGVTETAVESPPKLLGQWSTFNP